ncbi:MAG: hypothetical protein DK306_001216 [Chloroflexi bacterium]|nr:MAG: hypothetical protein DK306_001216 [Chloroflexota bacterium]
MTAWRLRLPLLVGLLLFLAALSPGQASAQAPAGSGHVATLQRFFDAMNGGDGDAALRLVTDRIVLEGTACSIGIEDCSGIDAVGPIIRAAAEAAAVGVTFTNEIVSSEVRGSRVTGVVHERAPDGFVAVDRIILFLEAEFVGLRIERLRLTPDLSDPQTAAADFVSRNFEASLSFFNLSLGVLGRLLDALNEGDIAAVKDELAPDVELQGALCAGVACEGVDAAGRRLGRWSDRTLLVLGNVRLLVNHRAGVGVTGVMADDAGLEFRYEVEVVGRRIVRLLFEALPVAAPVSPPPAPASVGAPIGLPATGSGGIAALGTSGNAPALAAPALVVMALVATGGAISSVVLGAGLRRRWRA